MKHGLIALCVYVLGFCFIQFLGGATGTKTILDYGHSDGGLLFLATVIPVFLSAAAFLCSVVFD